MLEKGSMDWIWKECAAKSERGKARSKPKLQTVSEPPRTSDGNRKAEAVITVTDNVFSDLLLVLLEYH